MFGPSHAKTCLRAYAESGGPDQPAHPRSLIRAFTVRLESLDSTECMNGEQRPRMIRCACKRWSESAHIAHVRNHCFVWKVNKWWIRITYLYYMITLMTKPTNRHVRPAKTQISLGIRPGLIRVFARHVWRNLGTLATYWAHSEDSDQTGRVPRLFGVFAGRTCHFVGFVVRWLIYEC